MRREMAADRRAVAEHRPVDDRAPVDRMRHRPPHPDVVEGRPRVVHREDRLALGRAHDHREARIGLELRQVLRRRKIRKRVDVPGHHRRERRRGVGDELERHPVERRRLAPVVVVADQLDLVALHPALEAERPRPHRVGRVGLGARRRHDHRVAPGEVPQERALGRVQSDLDGEVIDHVDRVDPLEELLLRVGRSPRPSPARTRTPRPRPSSEARRGT